MADDFPATISLIYTSPEAPSEEQLAKATSFLLSARAICLFCETNLPAYATTPMLGTGGELFHLCVGCKQKLSRLAPSLFRNTVEIAKGRIVEF